MSVILGKSEAIIHAKLHDMGANKKFGAYIPLKPMKLTCDQLAYLAGIIDGEGTITIKTHGKKIKPMI